MRNNNRGFINDSTEISKIVEMIKILEDSKTSLEVATKRLNNFALFVLMLRLEKYLKQECKKMNINYNDIVKRTKYEINQHDKIF